MVERFKKYTADDMPQIDGLSSNAQLLLWLLVRVGVPLIMCAVLAYYVSVKDKDLRDKDNQLASLNSEVRQMITRQTEQLSLVNANLDRLIRFGAATAHAETHPHKEAQ